VATPFGYISPEQLMKDRADYARKGIARGRSVLALQYQDGILFATENPSSTLHKISEIYDRIAFAAVGRYNEFENLRVAGVRLADLRGYSYDRRDVTGRALANAYAQTLGTIFSGPGEKPFEVEIVVAEVGDEPAGDSMYRLTYDGSVADEHGFVVMGGASEAIGTRLQQGFQEGLELAPAVRLAVEALAAASAADGGDGSGNGAGGGSGAGSGRPRAGGGAPSGGSARRAPIDPAQLEVAVLDRTRPRRKFRRLVDGPLQRLLSTAPAAGEEAASAEQDGPPPDE
jgi:proteasome alpha subunit